MQCGPRVPLLGAPVHQRPVTKGKITVYFHVGCPVCGRPLRVLVEYLGKRVACGHCQCRFVVVDPASGHDGPSALERADRLLSQCPPVRS